MSVSIANFTALEAKFAALEKTVSTNGAGADEMWHIIAGALIFFMHAGFSMLEAGSVSSKNTINILVSLSEDADEVLPLW